MSRQGLAQNELECQIWCFLGKNPKFYWRNQKFCYPPPGHFGQKMIFRGLFEKKKVNNNFTIGASLSPWVRIGWDPKYCSALSLFLKFFLHFLSPVLYPLEELLACVLLLSFSFHFAPCPVVCHWLCCRHYYCFALLCELWLNYKSSRFTRMIAFDPTWRQSWYNLEISWKK